MDDRSERLRKRRKRSTGPPDEEDELDETSRTTESSNGSELDDSSETDNTSDLSKPQRDEAPDENGDDTAADESTPVKEQQTGTYMYLPERQVKRLRRQYNVLKAEYEFEYDEEFEKNRHFYPLVVRHGLERLDEMDTAEIRDRVEEFYE